MSHIVSGHNLSKFKPGTVFQFTQFEEGISRASMLCVLAVVKFDDETNSVTVKAIALQNQNKGELKAVLIVNFYEDASKATFIVHDRDDRDDLVEMIRDPKGFLVENFELYGNG